MKPKSIVLVLALATAGCGGIEKGQEAKVQNHRLDQALGRYEAAKTNLERCTAAKLAAVAHEGRGNAAEAHAWRAREAADCQAALADFGPMVNLEAAPGEEAEEVETQ